MSKKKKEEDRGLESETMDALVAAEKTFRSHLENLGYESAFWDIRFTAWLLSFNSQNRLTRIEIEHEVKDKD